MRIVLDIVIVAFVVVTVWSSNPTVAKQDTAVSIDPTSMTATMTNLPTQQYDAF
jgi:hypothetical protein